VVKEAGVFEARTGMGVLVGRTGFDVTVGGMAVGVLEGGFSNAAAGVPVRAETRSDNLVSRFSITGLPGPAKRIQPKTKSPRTITRLMARAGVKIIKRSRNTERSGIAWLPGNRSERRSPTERSVSCGFSVSLFELRIDQVERIVE